jgi:hypothetical protein
MDDRYTVWAEESKRKKPHKPWFNEWHVAIVFVIALGVTLALNGP